MNKVIFQSKEEKGFDSLTITDLNNGDILIEVGNQFDSFEKVMDKEDVIRMIKVLQAIYRTEPDF